MFRATKIQVYIKAMRPHGIDAKRLLNGTEIDLDRISDPDYLISLDQYHAVISNMMTLSGDSGIAFFLGDVGNLGELGIVGYAMLSANSLRQAIDIWVEYSNSFVGTPTNIESYHDVSPGYELIISSTSTFGAFRRFETEELLVQGTKMVRYLTQAKTRVGRITFAYPEPPHRELYEKFFKCPIEFDAPRTDRKSVV